MEREKFLTVDIAARRLELSRETVYRFVKKGIIGSYRFGGSIKISEEQIAKYIKINEKEDIFCQ
jgi:excisionase family DNA binding protein